MSAQSTYLQIKQIRSQIGEPEIHRVRLKGLGLGKIGREVCLNDTAAIRGMVEKVHHLVDVQVKRGSRPKKGK